MRKKLVICLLFFLGASVPFASAKSAGTEKTSGRAELLSAALSGFRISSGYTNAFSLYNMDMYSKIAAGGFLGLEYTLLPDLFADFDAGFYSKTSYQYFVPYNMQLNRLDGVTLSGGLFCVKNFSEDISVFFSVGIGFMISMIDFTSAEGTALNDVYYDFALESDFYIRKKIIGTNVFQLLMGPGCHFSFYNEKSKSFCSFGPGFSLSVDFSPARTK